MFGDEDQAQQSQGSTDQPTTDSSANVPVPSDDTSPAAPTSDLPVASDSTSQDSSTPKVDWTAPTDSSDNSSPLDDQSMGAPAPSGGGDASALLDIKQQALQQLTPLMGHLDQTPEEKFRTTMMMIQASDNQELIKVAYDAAMAIPDEKSKALALLDVVNEINYFTQQPEA